MQPEFLIPITLFCGAAVVLWKFFDTRHRERMAMIEKGLRPAEFGAGVVKPQNILSTYASLKWGLLAVFVGIGIFVANWLHEVLRMEDGPANFGSVFVFGGVALVLHYIISMRRIRKEEKAS